MDNPHEKKSVFNHPFFSNIFVIGIVMAALPVTVLFVQQRQAILQEASIKNSPGRQGLPGSITPDEDTPTPILFPTVTPSSDAYSIPTAIISQPASSGNRITR